MIRTTTRCTCIFIDFNWRQIKAAVITFWFLQYTYMRRVRKFALGRYRAIIECTIKHRVNWYRFIARANLF